jgi:DNA polymerase-1
MFMPGGHRSRGATRALPHSTRVTDDTLTQYLRSLGAEPGQRLGVAIAAGVGLGLSAPQGRLACPAKDPSAIMDALNRDLSPRWTWWDRGTAAVIVDHRMNIDRCWDVLAVQRLLDGRWTTSVASVWAQLHDLDIDAIPAMGQLGLLDAAADEGTDPEIPVRPDGHLRPEWVDGAWARSPERLAAWADLATTAASLQETILGQRRDPARALSTAHSESGAELLCAELAVGGLPLDVAEATRIIRAVAGPRPRTWDDEETARTVRDKVVTDLVPSPQAVNLRNPDAVKAVLRRAGIELADTRKWRLEQVRHEHPVVEALLTWRKAERIATTYGYRWLDEHVVEGRLRGDWSSSDGAAGRMTASAGLHNLPSEMRPAVAADPGRVLVRADLGQVEPRVLAAVSGDDAFIAATHEQDLYQPVAHRLGVEREVAKLAVLGAMYGSTTGESAHALRGLEQNYPVAMKLLADAADSGAAGQDIFTIGGRRVRMWKDPSGEGDIDKARSLAAARGRFARNALIQGAAAEFFKVWAIVVRRRARSVGASVVLCLHDELLVDTAEDRAEETAELVSSAVAEAAHYWSPEPGVRFLADVSIVQRWSDAKA